MWKPKIPSEFAKRAARYNKFCWKQRNPRNLRPKTSGDMSYNSFKAGRSSKDTMAQIWNLERHLGKHCSYEVQPANSRQPALANLTCLREVGGIVSGKDVYRLPPSPLPPFFTHSRFRCSRASFASRSLSSLIYTDREAGTAVV